MYLDETNWTQMNLDAFWKIDVLWYVLLKLDIYIYYISLDEMWTNPSGESSKRISDCCWCFWASPIARAAQALGEPSCFVVLTILKNMSSSTGRIVPYMKRKIKKCLKPPTSDLSIYPVIIILLLPVYLCFVASRSGPLRPSRWGKFRKSTHRKSTNRPQRLRMRNGDNVANPIINCTLKCIYTCIST